MRTKSVFLSLSFVFALIQTNFTQTLPAKIKNHLDKNFKGWKLSPSTESCAWEVNGGFVSGYFNGDGKRDYAVKITRGKKGYILAFLALKNGYKPFVIHDTDADDVTYRSIFIYKKGKVIDYNEKDFRLKYDAFADFRCESDVGGFHFYQNGKFIAT